MDSREFPERLLQGIKSSILTNRKCYTNLIRATRGSAIDAILVFSLTSPLLKVNNEKKC